MTRLRERDTKMRFFRSFKPHLTAMPLLMAIVASVLVGCASTGKVSETLSYPADLPQPYLTLEQVIEGAQDSPEGLFSRFLGIIVGPERKFTLNQPTDMVVDQKGRLLIVESESGFISIYTEVEGEWLNSERVRIPEILHPTSIAAGPEKIFISDLMGGNVHILDYNFNLLGIMSHSDMQRPGGLCFDAYSNRVLIADPPAHKIFIFSPSGEYQAQIGQSGHTNGRLQSPLAMTIDTENGNIYVLDGMARKVKQYGPDFQFISSFGAYDQVPGSFAFPKGIALAVDGTLFVGDAAFGNIQMFDPSGALLFYFGETGTGQGQFLMPRNLFLDEEQRLFVADPYNNRVQIFRYFAQK